ncbi:GNAT family N-acetyltransferase [Clostridium sp. CS001]|uniref:GNAT family N-acetyltransferase n=1 Tax=Clostridium sp. CS001 TaxID=2880648 RepID=UPI001CF48701|nr:GNAT family N-acetyltransferase [Clostridium sp. CS001]MCB2290047.1 GNAT family N-acetyltransferase [Clostridium sp. CS001]
MNTLYTREVVEDDFQNIYLLNKDLGYEYDEQKVKIRIQHILKNTKDVIFVAEQNHEVIGYIHGSPYELIYADSLVNILGLVVKEQHRKLGIGGKLIDRLEVWAKENGFYGIRLVSGADRLNAHKFYKNHEYVYRKDQKSFIKAFY